MSETLNINSYKDIIEIGENYTFTRNIEKIQPL